MVRTKEDGRPAALRLCVQGEVGDDGVIGENAQEPSAGYRFNERGDVAPGALQRDRNRPLNEYGRRIGRLRTTEAIAAWRDENDAATSRLRCGDCSGKGGGVVRRSV